MQKNKHSLLFILLIFLCCIAYYTVRGFSFFNTDVEQSVQIFAQMNLQNNFTDADKVGMGSPATKTAWQDNLQKVSTAYFKNEFRGTLSDEKIDKLADAELAMNKKRKITVSDVKIDGDKATATVAISKVNYSNIADEAIKNAKAAENDGGSSPEKFSETLADELIKGFEAAQPSDEMTSFSVDLKKELINNNRDKNDAVSDFIAKYIVPHVGGYCWYPKDNDDFFEQINKAAES